MTHAKIKMNKVVELVVAKDYLGIILIEVITLMGN
jgi:hypothetical protein